MKNGKVKVLFAAVSVLSLCFFTASGARAVDETAMVGRITKVIGEVSISRTTTAAPIVVKKKGLTIQNPFVLKGDVITTGSGSSTTVEFAFDGDTGKPSRLEINENSSVSINKVVNDPSRKLASGKTQGRRIKILVGNVVSDISPNPVVETVFETPVGVAAVKGTITNITVGEKADVNFWNSEGVLYIQTEDGLHEIDLNESQGVELKSSTGAVLFTVTIGTDGSVVIKEPYGISVHLVAGAKIEIFDRDGISAIRVLEGEALVKSTESEMTVTMQTGSEMEISSQDEETFGKVTDGVVVINMPDQESTEAGEDTVVNFTNGTIDNLVEPGPPGGDWEDTDDTKDDAGNTGDNPHEPGAQTTETTTQFDLPDDTSQDQGEASKYKP